LLVLNERLEFVGNRASAIAKTKGAQYGRGPHSDFEISARDVEEHRVRVASLEKKRGRHLITKIYPGPSLDGVQAMEPRAFGGMGIEADVSLTAHCTYQLAGYALKHCSARKTTYRRLDS